MTADKLQVLGLAVATFYVAVLVGWAIATAIAVLRKAPRHRRSDFGSLGDGAKSDRRG
jgi:hypothetical protein